MNTIDRLPRTPFGAPLLDDYGQDDLSRYNADLFDDHDRELQAEWQRIVDGDVIPHKRERRLLLAMFDAEAPAKRKRKTVYEGWAVDISRTPDYWDDGKAWWIGEYGVVGYDAMQWSKALSVCENHGYKVLRGVQPSQYGLTVIPHGEGLWATEAFAKAESNYAYMLWTIAQSTLDNN